MKKVAKILIHLSVLLILVMPVLSIAQTDGYQGLVPCGKTDENGKIAKQCDFDSFIALINKIVNFFLFVLAIPIAAIMFAWAGFIMMFSGGGEARNKGKEVLWNTVKGLLLAAGAWLIVHTILTVMGYNEPGDWFGFKESI